MPVLRTAEFQRIAALPRQGPISDRAIDLLYRFLRCSDDAPRPRREQAEALYQAADNGGGFFPISVGKGKFLISVLIPTVRPDAERPLIFVPANLKQQTIDEIAKWSEWYRIRADLRVESYDLLSRISGAEMLASYQPGIIVGDEAHKFSNRQAARTKRLRNYLREFPSTEVYWLSGSMTEKSILEYHHLMLWALADPPLPRGYHEAKNWGRALDQEVRTGRIDAGPLWEFVPGPGRTLDDLRAGYRERVTSAPGVYGSPPDELGVSLVVQEISLPVPESVKDDFAKLRDTWETPGGDEIDSPTALYRHSRELAVGFYYRWDPPPPAEWLDARREWNRFVRETLAQNHPGIESPLQVARACAEGVLDDHYWAAWAAVRDTYQFNSEPVWQDRFAVEFAEDWAIKHNGIVWVSHRAIGNEFKRIPYFGGGKKGDKIRQYSGPCAASIPAHGTGKNLTQWSRALVLSPPSGGKAWEQLLGRLHRPGQTADEVIYEVVLNSAETYDGFERAREKSLYADKSLHPAQRLSYATVLISDETRRLARERREPQWQR